MDVDRDADCPDAISEKPVESETTEQPGPSGLSILEALKAPRLSSTIIVNVVIFF